MDRFEFRYVMGHVEVFDLNGGFCFSADSMAEAMDELREEMQAALNHSKNKKMGSKNYPTYL